MKKLLSLFAIILFLPFAVYAGIEGTPTVVSTDNDFFMILDYSDDGASKKVAGSEVRGGGGGGSNVTGPSTHLASYSAIWGAANSTNLLEGYLITDAGKNLAGDGNITAQRATLGLVIGTDVEATLTDKASLESTISDVADFAEADGDTYTGTHSFDGANVEIPNSGTLPASCTVGQHYMDTNATTGQRFYLCETTNNWVKQGDGGGGSGDLLADGSVPLTANWDVGAFTITALRFVSDQATGTAPLTVASTTKVTNLNADTCDGQSLATSDNVTFHKVTATEGVVIGASPTPGWTGDVNSTLQKTIDGHIYLAATDSGNGTVDIDLYAKILVNDVLTTRMHLDADGNNYFPGADMNIENGKVYKINNVQVTSAALSNDASLAKATGDVYTGTHDFGGADDLEIPNGNNPVTDTEGQIAHDTDDAALEVYSTRFTASVLTAPEEITLPLYVMAEPDQLQPIADAWPLYHFVAETYPHGVTIRSIHISASSTCDDPINFEEWSNNGTAWNTDATVEAITLSGTYTQDDGTLTDAAMAADSYLYADLNGTMDDIASLSYLVTITINPGD